MHNYLPSIELGTRQLGEKFIGLTVSVAGTVQVTSYWSLESCKSLQGVILWQYVS